MNRLSDIVGREVNDAFLDVAGIVGVDAPQIGRIGDDGFE